MKLVVVESPAKAKTINKYLGKDYEVLASFGHIRDLPSKNGSVEPENDFNMHYEVDKESAKKFKPIVEAAKRCDELILATDPDREGEAISWHVLEVLLAKKAIKKTTPVSRVVFNAITKNAVQHGIDNPRELDMALIDAQQARRALDYLVGFTLSPVLWRKLPGSRSAGRVQSVALRLICERESEIEQFISREYWDITAELAKKINARLTHVDGDKLGKFDIPNEKSAKDIEARLKGQKLTVAKIDEKQAQRSPKPPFITSTLQQEASRKLGFGAKQTMMAAQKLYEQGLITYMRTDGVFVAPEAVESTRKLIAKDFGKDFVPEKAREYVTKAKNSQEAHEAIRPTDLFKTPEIVGKELEPDLANLYGLVWKRMVSSQMANAIFDQVAIDFETDDKFATLRANGSIVQFEGFRKVYEESTDDSKEEAEKTLPKVKLGEVFDVKKLSPEQHNTEPPPRYSEASLVKRMEELGIGRPSTYASIISVLQDRDYVVIEKKRFIPESRGRIVTAFLSSFFEKYVEYDYTANLEDQLDEVSEGKKEWKQVLRDFWTDFSGKTAEAMELQITDVLEKLNSDLEKYIFPNGRKCPSCDEGILGLRLGKFGGFIGCNNHPECKHTKQLSYADDGEDGEGPEEGRVLGTHPDGDEITVKKGPYGWYIQLGEEKEVEGAKGKMKKLKPKRFSITKGTSPDEVTMEQAIKWLSLPRDVGEHPETGKMIKAGIGRFGPYLIHDSKFTSLKEDDVFEVGMNRAVEIIASAPVKGKGGKLRDVGEYKKKPVEIHSGRYGAYIKYGKSNVALPKGTKHEELTLEEAGKLIEAKKKK